MKSISMAMLASTLVLGACAAPPRTSTSPAKCDAPGFEPQTYELRIRKDPGSGVPSHVVVHKFLTDFEVKALAVRAGDRIEWKLAGDFAIDFPVDGPEGGPRQYKGNGKVKLSVPCRDFCSDPGAIPGAGVCYRLYKYGVVNSAGSLDPIIVVER